MEASNKQEKACQEHNNLKEEIELLHKKLFTSFDGKRVCNIPGQMNLFNEAQPNPAIAITEKLETTTSHKCC